MRWTNILKFVSYLTYFKNFFKFYKTHVMLLMINFVIKIKI